MNNTGLLSTTICNLRGKNYRSEVENTLAVNYDYQGENSLARGVKYPTSPILKILLPGRPLNKRVTPAPWAKTP